MADSNYTQALPVAMEAVKEGQDLFKPQPDLRLFPLFLLGAQVSIAGYYHDRHVCQYICEHPKKSHSLGGNPLAFSACNLHCLSFSILHISLQLCQTQTWQKIWLHITTYLVLHFSEAFS